MPGGLYDHFLDYPLELGAPMECAVCGCTDEEACPGGCIWAAPGLCSRCAREGAGAELLGPDPAEFEALSYDDGGAGDEPW